MKNILSIALLSCGAFAATNEVQWIGHPMVSDNDYFTPSQGWTTEAIIGLRNDGVVVWKPVPEKRPLGPTNSSETIILIITNMLNITNIGANLMLESAITNVPNGEVCVIRGHDWESGCGVLGCLVNHGDTPMRHCRICGKTQIRKLGPWE